ncbi:MAG: hypothetical protein LBT19_01460 [Candidatus Nomurabacteria bacterium]|jgi:hypothetical protein|nr:hypothetical protein [Candidatus Nomurabacteria bacterium]
MNEATKGNGEFNSKDAMSEIWDMKNTDRVGAKAKIAELKQNLAALQERMADAFNELAALATFDTQVSRKELVGIVKQYSDGLDTNTQELFYDGISKYMDRRSYLKRYRSTVGDKRILQDVVENNRYASDKENFAILNIDESILSEVADRSRVEMGPVNYNIFIDSKDMRRLGIVNEEFSEGSSVRGMTVSSAARPYSIIFTDRTRTREPHKLEKAIGIMLRTSASTDVDIHKVVAHENQHQIDYFAQEVISDESHETHNSPEELIMTKKLRLRKLSELGAPEFLIKKNKDGLLSAINQLEDEEDKYGSLDDLPEEYWRHIKRKINESKTKTILYKLKDEVIAFLVGQGRSIAPREIERYLDRYFQAYSIDEVDRGAISDHVMSVIDRADKALKELHQIEGNWDRALTMLTYQNLTQWPKIVRRVKAGKELGKIAAHDPTRLT